MHAYRVASDLPGAIWIMPYPKDGTLESLRVQGVDGIVSLLPVEESISLGLSDQASACAQLGLWFERHEIIDFGLPDPAYFVPMIRDLATRVRNGAQIAVHCRAGIGRSGMTVVATLMALGMDAETAVAQVSAARGVSVPDTAEQLVFLQDLRVT